MAIKKGGLILFFFVLGINARAQEAGSKIKATVDQYGNIRCSNGAATTVRDLLNARAPTLPSFSYSPSIPIVCVDPIKDQVDNLIKSFKEADKANIQGIANSFCSYQEGWIEHHPGTCTAGGPPPICVEDHWYQANRADALAALAKDLKRVSTERAEKVTSLQNQQENSICSCWLNELKKEDQAALNNRAQANNGIGSYGAPINPSAYLNSNNPTGSYLQSGNSASSSIKFPCMGGCPQGYTCQDGFCVQTEYRPVDKIDKVTHKIQQKIEGTVTDAAKGKLQEELLKQMGPVGLRMRAVGRVLGRYNLYVTVAEAALKPTMMGGGNQTFMSKIADINSSTEHLENLYLEYSRYIQGLNQVRDIRLIKDDIHKEQSALGMHLSLLYGYRREASLSCKGCCDQILDHQVSRIGEHVTRLFNFKVD